MSDILTIFSLCISIFIQLSERRHEMFLEKLFFKVVMPCALVILLSVTAYVAVYAYRFVMNV